MGEMAGAYRSPSTFRLAPSASRPLYWLLAPGFWLLIFLSASGLGADGLSFVDTAASSGISYRNKCGGPEKKYLVELNGNGVAILDYDNDGHLDILFINGSSIESYKNGGDQVCYLYRNIGGKFVDVTAEAGLSARGWGAGVAVGDYDNDGWDDIYITCLGPNILFRNEGGRFVQARAGTSDERWSTGAAFLDYDRDGDLDLFVANYVDYDLNNPPPPGSGLNCQYRGIPVACGPRGLKGAGDALYRNNGDGTFTDVSREAGVEDGPGYYGFGVVPTDYDRDGWIDIYVANDSTPNYLYRNNGNGTFTETALIAGAALNEDGKEQAGMGTDAGDYDNDGYADLYVTNFSDDTNTLYHNERDGSFSDVTYQTGHGITWTYLGWGAGFVDLDNDGWKDIFVANGHIYPAVDSYKLGTSYRQRNLVFLNKGGKGFKELKAGGPGLRIEKSFRGAAFGDYDEDGDIDIVVQAIDDAPALLRNDGGNKSNWLKIKLVGRRSNRSAIGAKVSVTAGDLKQHAEVKSGSSYISHSDMRLHFGLGSKTKVDLIEIEWPSGSRQSVKDVEANKTLTLVEEN